MMHIYPVTPSDTVGLPAGSFMLSFVNSGTQTLAITTTGGETVTGIILPSGQWRIEAKQVWSTGTTVTSIFMYTIS